MKFLTEMPWRSIDVNCPNCNYYISNYDWFVELWNKEATSKDILRKTITSLMVQKLLPVICPKCGTYFVVDTTSHKPVIQPMPEIFQQNKDIIMKTYQDRFMSFKEFVNSKPSQHLL